MSARCAAGLCGGVVESTPYIGHPAFKSMGAGAGYAILTGLFIGIGGIVGVLPFFVDWIPASAIAPMLVYIGLEVIAQAFLASPRRHALAVAISLLPSFAFLISLETGSVLSALGAQCRSDWRRGWGNAAHVESAGQRVHHHGDSWGAATAELIDRRFRASALYLLTGAVFCLFGVIHSPTARGNVPVAVADWGRLLPWHLAAAYVVAALTMAGARFLTRDAGTLRNGERRLEIVERIGRLGGRDASRQAALPGRE